MVVGGRQESSLDSQWLIALISRIKAGKECGVRLRPAQAAWSEPMSALQWAPACATHLLAAIGGDAQSRGKEGA